MFKADPSERKDPCPSPGSCSHLMLLPRTASPWPPWPVGAPRARSLTAAGAREVEWLSRLAGLEGAGVVRRGGLASLSPWNDAYKGGVGCTSLHALGRSQGSAARACVAVRTMPASADVDEVRVYEIACGERACAGHPCAGTSGGVPFTSSACRAASAAASTAAALALAARDAGDWPSLLACAHMRGLVWRASVG